MKHLSVFFFFLLSTLFSFAQPGGEVKGTIKDATTGETIVGASVLYTEGKGTVTDINGNFSLKFDSAGQYTLTVSYVGYEVQKMKVKVGGKPVILSFSLQTQTLNEVEVVADVAKTRETPIAFSNISSKQISEELGTRDLPMVLNSTPGVYATEQGGGSGDARVSIRGFDQRNVAVMVDGVPVNDMENGQVYWSNWDGLGDITRTMQVQRGLGASKLAVASVGGTINIITKGIDQKMSAGVKQEVSDYGLNKTSFGFNTGQLKGGWGFTVAGSRKWGSGFADATFDDAYSYFFKVQKRFKKHLFSLSASGAPQKHGQRLDRLPIAVYSEKLAKSLGINTDSVYRYMGTHANQYYTTSAIGERGLEYNPNWGRYHEGPFNNDLNCAILDDKINYFHKPQINFSHFWSPGEKLNVSTVIYLSVGKGGGTGLKTPASRDVIDGQLNLQSIYAANISSSAISPSYSTTERASSNYLRAANNDHIWYGILSSWNYTVNKNLSALLGIDARYYKGTHYQSVYDLMGGDYAIENPGFKPSNSAPPFAYVTGDANQPTGTYPNDPNLQNSMKHVGDKISYYNDAKVIWGGVFGQVEYKKNKWSTFLTGSFSNTGYQRIDYFKRKDLVIDGDVFSQVVGYNDVFYYNGSEHITAYKGATTYTNGDTTFIDNPGSGPILSIVNAKAYTNQSPEARFSTTKLLWFLGYTIKGGANYNINDHHNVFINLGFLNLPPRFTAVFDNANKMLLEIKNQKVYAIESGYGFKSHKFAANVNLYYTLWRNKPPQFTPQYVTPDGERFSYNLNGLDALHKGIELDFIYKLLKNLDVEGIVSLGDWKTVSGQKIYIYDEQNILRDSADFSAKNVHVGDAAQIQLGGSIRYEIIKNLYIKPRFTYFAKNYANFDPLTLTYSVSSTGVVTDNRNRESWKMPNYGILDLFLGYDFTVWKMKMGVAAGVSNLLNKAYISDAQNNGDLNNKNFDANSATVYMGMGTRYNVALKIGF
ncbi:MAG: TonB-dependent receptor plug [Bacteroidetes bacterium]|nr:TonB-dependent receptor plug [Bacteroidota bacterium]